MFLHIVLSFIWSILFCHLTFWKKDIVVIRAVTLLLLCNIKYQICTVLPCVVLIFTRVRSSISLNMKAIQKSEIRKQFRKKPRKSGLFFENFFFLRHIQRYKTYKYWTIKCGKFIDQLCDLRVVVPCPGLFDLVVCVCPWICICCELYMAIPYALRICCGPPVQENYFFDKHNYLLVSHHISCHLTWNICWQFVSGIEWILLLSLVN